MKERSKLLQGVDIKKLPVMTQEGNLTFKVTKLLDVPDEIIIGAKKGASLVWEQHVDEPAIMRLTFTGTLTTGGKKNVEDIAASYDPNSDTLVFSVSQLQNNKLGLDAEAIAVFYSAHEARHKVQTFQGDTPLPRRELPTQADYANARHEKEAWQETTEVMKKIYPDLQLSFVVAGKNYNLPDKSKY